MDRERLYKRIEARVDAMVAAGVEEEVRRADAAGASATARKALGFEEFERISIAELDVSSPTLRRGGARRGTPGEGLPPA